MSTIYPTATFYRGPYQPIGPCVGYESGSGVSSIARYAFRTGAEGASSLSFRTESCHLTLYAQGDENAPETIAGFSFLVSSKATGYEYYKGSEGSPCGFSYDEYLSGTAQLKLMPNTDYYLWIYPNYRTYALWTVGGCTIELSGSYGSPSTARAEDGIFGQPLQISLSRSMSQMRHSLRIDCLGQSVQILENSASYPLVQWHSRLEDFAPLMPDFSSATATIILESYLSGSLIGSTQTQITMRLPQDFAPIPSTGWVSLQPLNQGAAEGFGCYIPGYSRIRAVFDPTKLDFSHLYGAKLESLSMEIEGQSYSEPWESPLIHGETQVSCIARDSRGQQTRQDFTVSPLPYSPPSLSLISVFRADAEGNRDENGLYCALCATLNISSLGGENRGSLSAAYAPKDGSYGAESPMESGKVCLIGPVSPDISCSLRITGSDALGSTVSALRSLPTRIWAVKFAADGQAVAFGKAPEQSHALELHPDWSIVRGEEKALFTGNFYSFTATLPTSGWQAEGDCFKQSVAVSGLSDTDRPIIDLKQDESLSLTESAALEQQWGQIFMALTDRDSLRLYARKAPEKTLEIQGMGVRL